MIKKRNLFQSLFGKSLFICIAVAMCSAMMVSCGGDDDDDDEGGGGSSSASVKITSVVEGSKRNGQYNYHVTVKASGVSAGNVKDIGVTWGVTSAASQKRSGTREVLSTTRSINLSANTVYYLKGYVTTSGGTSYTAAKRVRVSK